MSYSYYLSHPSEKEKNMSQRICRTASLIIMGDEILRGQIIDTNTSYLAKNLTAAGVRLQKVTVVPDVVRIILV